MNAKEQYQEFALWLRSKSREVGRDYDATFKGEGSPELRSRYAELLKRIMAEIIWTERQIEGLKNA